MSEWKQVKSIGIHETLKSVVIGLKDVVETELEKTNKKIEALKRIAEMKEKKKNG